MNLSAETLMSNFETLLAVIEAKINDPVKKEGLLRLHNDWADRIATAPASTKKSYHNAFPGGYVLHVLNVIKGVGLISNAWKKMGMELDFTEEEMYFSAICHDIGKIGDEKYDYYVECQEQWMVKKGQVYVTNPKLQFMKVAERSLMTLHNRAIPITEKEYLSIKLHDGLYEDANKAYLISYNEDYALRTSLPYVLHQADLMSAKVEEVVSKK